MSHMNQFNQAAMGGGGYQFAQQQSHQLPFGAQQPPPQPQQQQIITAPTCRDVLNGRGQGVQRHPGNVKYRTLVFVNKGLYAKCPRSDKMKISKGIVAAVRELGGRFLKLDERTSIYQDIGDKLATEKTSQALREGQTKIRKQMYKDENSGFDTSLMGAAGAVPMPSQREISAEGYFGYSVQVLESLYNSEENALSDGSAPQKPPTSVAATMAQQPPRLAFAPQAVPSTSFGAGSADSAAMEMALDQFPGAVPPPQAQMPPLPQPNVNEAEQAAIRGSIGRFTESSGFRLTNMSMGSMFSVRDLLESAREFQPAMENERGTLGTALTKEICELIRASEKELIQVERMTMEGMDNSHEDSGPEDKEVVIAEDAQMNDRVSELRFTDVARDTKFAAAAAATDGDVNPRLTESSDSTNYSKTSLMDASMMTFEFEKDRGTKHSPEKKSPDKKTDLASAELLLGFSDGKNQTAV